MCSLFVLQEKKMELYTAIAKLDKGGDGNESLEVGFRSCEVPLVVSSVWQIWVRRPT